MTKYLSSVWIVLIFIFGRSFASVSAPIRSCDESTTWTQLASADDLYAYDLKSDEDYGFAPVAGQHIDFRAIRALPQDKLHYLQLLNFTPDRLAPLLKAFSRQQRLKGVYLYGSDLTSATLSHLAAFPELHQLILQRCTGMQPFCGVALKKVTYLELNSGNYNNVLTSISLLSDLQSLRITNYDFPETQLAQLNACPQLKAITFEHVNSLTSTSLLDAQWLARLRCFALIDNLSIHENDFTFLKNLKFCEIIKLYDCDFNESQIEYLMDLSNLKEVWLSKSTHTPAIATRLATRFKVVMRPDENQP